MAQFGIDWEGPTPSNEWDGSSPNETAGSVEVPDTRIPLSNDEYTELSQTVNPLQDSEYHGVDLYLNTLAFIAEKISSVSYSSFTD